MKDTETLERSFSLLKVNGVLDKVSGIILGKHELFDDKGTGLKPYEILQEVLNGRPPHSWLTLIAVIPIPCSPCLLEWK